MLNVHNVASFFNFAPSPTPDIPENTNSLKSEIRRQGTIIRFLNRRLDATLKKLWTANAKISQLVYELGAVAEERNAAEVEVIRLHEIGWQAFGAAWEGLFPDLYEPETDFQDAPEYWLLLAKREEIDRQIAEYESRQ
jgi:hypothetical protein